MNLTVFGSNSFHLFPGTLTVLSLFVFWTLNNGLGSWGLMLQYLMGEGDLLLSRVWLWGPPSLLLTGCWTTSCALWHSQDYFPSIKSWVDDRVKVWKFSNISGTDSVPISGCYCWLGRTKTENTWLTVWCIDLHLARARDGMQARLVSGWSQEMGTESVPETPENFQTLVWPSAREDFIEYRHHVASRLILFSLKSWTFHPLSGQDWSYRWSDL